MRIKYTRELLEPIIEKSTTWADVCRSLNLKPMTGSQCHVKKRAIDFNINFSHFVGKSFNKGKFLKKKDALEYCFNGSKVKSHALRLKLIRDGYKEKKCEKCNNIEWLDDEIPLELHHIDGNHFNNEFENLMILCPNCHSRIRGYTLKKNKKERKKYNISDNKKCGCGELITNKAMMCVKCYHTQSRKTVRPSVEILLNDVNDLGYVKTGLKYDVSDNTIRKWLK